MFSLRILLLNYFLINKPQTNIPKKMSIMENASNAKRQTPNKYSEEKVSNEKHFQP